MTSLPSEADWRICLHQRAEKVSQCPAADYEAAFRIKGRDAVIALTFLKVQRLGRSIAKSLLYMVFLLANRQKTGNFR